MVERLAPLPRGRDRDIQIVANAILAVYSSRARGRSPASKLRVFLDTGTDATTLRLASACSVEPIAHRISSRSAAFSACSNVGSDMVCRVASMAFSA
jgi:hypothetical protein